MQIIHNQRVGSTLLTSSARCEAAIADYRTAWSSLAVAPVALYHMNEGTGTTLLDATGMAPGISITNAVFDWSSTGDVCQ